MKKFLMSVLLVLMLAITAYSASAAASITVSPATFLYKGDFGQTITKQVTIKNTGTENLTIGFTENDLSGFEFNYSSKDFALAAGKNKTVDVTLTLPEKNPSVYKGNIVVGSTSASKTINVTVDLTDANTLVISSLEVEGDSMDDGDTFADMAPLDEMTIAVTVENNEEDEGDSIQNIMVTATIKNFENGGEDDVDIESDEFDLDGNGDDKDVDLTFTVPYDIEDNKEYQVTIKVEGEGDGDNNDGDDYDVEWVIYLKGNKEKNTVKLTETDIAPTEVSCGTNVEFDATVANIGSNDLDDAAIEIKSTLLSLSQKYSSLSLDSDPDKSDFEVTKSFTWEVPSTVKAGTYDVEFYAYFDSDKQADHVTKKLTVTKCDTAPAPNNTITPVTPKPTVTPTVTPGISYSQETSLRDSPLYLAALIAVIVAALVLIVFLILKMVGTI